jgi:hypothetical protein
MCAGPLSNLTHLSSFPPSLRLALSSVDDARSNGKVLTARGGARGAEGGGVVELLAVGSIRGFDKSSWVIAGLDEVGVHSADPSEDDHFVVSLVG